IKYDKDNRVAFTISVPLWNNPRLGTHDRGGLDKDVSCLPTSIVHLSAVNEHRVASSPRKHRVSVVGGTVDRVGRKKVVDRERRMTPVLGHTFDDEHNPPELGHQLPWRQIVSAHERPSQWRIGPSKSDLKRILEQGKEARRSIRRTDISGDHRHSTLRESCQLPQFIDLCVVDYRTLFR